MNNSQPYLSLVVPAHNEEGNLTPLVKTLTEALERYGKIESYEILFVDDNSTDGTPAIVDSLAKSYPSVRAVHRTSHPGFGNAVKKGLGSARGEILIPLMADLSEEPEDIFKLVEKIEEGYDIAYGSRFCPGGSTSDYPLVKLLLNRLGNHTIGLAFGISHKDITNAFKAYRREVIQAIGVENLEAEHFDLTIEIPLKAHILGFKSAEVPVSWKNRTVGEAKLKLTRHCQKYAGRLFKMLFWGNLVALRELFSSLGGLGFKKVLFGFVLGLGLLVSIFSIFGFSRVFSLVSKINPIFLVAGFLTFFLSFVFRTWRWSVLLRSCGYRTRRRAVFKILLFGWFLNYLFPARVGDVARGVALTTTENKPLLVGIFTVLLERAMDMFVLALFLSTSLVFLAHGEQLFYLSGLAMGGAFLLVLSAFLLSRYDYFLYKKLPLQSEQNLKDQTPLSQSLKNLWYNPLSLFLCLLITPLIWIAEVLVFYFAAASLGLWDLSIPLAMASSIVSFLSQALPTVPAGMGIHEGAIGAVWKFFGRSGSLGSTVALVDHFVRACLIYPLGALCTIHIGFASRNYFRRRRENSMPPKGSKTP